MKMKAPEDLMKLSEMLMKGSHYPCLYFMKDSSDKMNEMDGQS